MELGKEEEKKLLLLFAEKYAKPSMVVKLIFGVPENKQDHSYTSTNVLRVLSD
jgi:hypothetical protein